METAEDHLIRGAELLQAFKIANALSLKALTKKNITAQDVEIAAGYEREAIKKLDDLRLTLRGITP